MQISINKVADINKGSGQGQVRVITDLADFKGFLNGYQTPDLKECYQRPDNWDWLPGRLRNVTIQAANYRISQNIAELAAQRGDKPFKASVGLGAAQEMAETIDLCPSWYSDLAKIPENLNIPDAQAKVDEYFEKMKETLEEVLNSHGIPPWDWQQHYESLIANEESSQKIQAEFMDVLTGDPRTVQLMEELGILGSKEAAPESGPATASQLKAAYFEQSEGGPLDINDPAVRRHMISLGLPDWVGHVYFGGYNSLETAEERGEFASIVMGYLKEVKEEFGCDDSSYLPYESSLPEYDKKIKEGMKASFYEKLKDNPRAEQLAKKLEVLWPPERNTAENSGRGLRQIHMF